MRTAIVALVAMLLAAALACAPKVVPVPVVTAPRFPDFLKPPVPAELAATPAAASYERGWRFLQAGDFRNAERELSASLRASPDFLPAHTAAGYLDLAERKPDA